jgi:hypothetical protein
MATNDFARDRQHSVRDRVRGAGWVLVVAVVASGAAWTLTHAEFGIWPTAWAASVFPLSEMTDLEPSPPDPQGADLPRYVGESLVRPVGWERWVAVGASLGLSYTPGASPHEAFHQVRITASAYDAFRRTGAFPEGTQIALEVSSLGANVLPARAGRFADQREGLEIAVKDRRAAPDGWAYYGFGDGSAAIARRFAASSCSSCHRQHAATDNVFTQFYPKLKRLDNRGRG